MFLRGQQYKDTKGEMVNTKLRAAATSAGGECHQGGHIPGAFVRVGFCFPDIGGDLTGVCLVLHTTHILN